MALYVVITLITIIFKEGIMILIPGLRRARIRQLQVTILNPLTSPVDHLNVSITVFGNVRNFLSVFTCVIMICCPAIPRARIRRRRELHARVLHRLRRLVRPRPIQRTVAPIPIPVPQALLCQPCHLLPLGAINVLRHTVALRVASTKGARRQELRHLRRSNRVKATAILPILMYKERRTRRIGACYPNAIAHRNGPTCKTAFHDNSFNNRFCPLIFRVCLCVL